MNTNQLKRFAQDARRKLLTQVGAKLSFVLATDSPELREKLSAVKQLREELERISKEQLIEKVAYTWFNRLMAMRFMDTNDYQPLGIRIITPKDGYTIPELLDEAKRGNLSDELKMNRQKVYDLLDGKIPSNNPQNEAYKELLIAACNHLHTTFPFLFEKINDYTELLLPDDLTSDFSIVTDVRDGMPMEDCQNVEIIGWLYQFYISEKKDEVFASKSKVKKEDIPAATQLFTPRWIVEYMVQNTLGKLWLQNRPKSSLREHMPYFIESASLEAEEYLKIQSPEEIRLLDPACGSGHILVYAFDLFTKIYEEEGYNTSEIPQLIIHNNLYGFEIDERAAQLSALALMMKAREYHRRFFRKEARPNILCYSDLKLKAYNHDEYKETVAVKANSSTLSEFLEYRYVYAENLVKQWDEEFKDEDTGELVLIKRYEIVFRKGAKARTDDLPAIKALDVENVLFFEDEIKENFRLQKISVSDELYHDLLLIKQATNFGSLVIPHSHKNEIETVLDKLTHILHNGDVFQRSNVDAIIGSLNQLLLLGQKFHCVVANPPYMGSTGMNINLSEFVKNNYPQSKSDLMACFMESGLKMLINNGYLGMINQHSWMFLSSYEELRVKLIDTVFFDTLLHLGAKTFPEIGGEVVQNTCFTLYKGYYLSQGVYIRLVNFYNSELKRLKVLQAIKDSNCGWYYLAKQGSFGVIPTTTFAYWVSDAFKELFDNKKLADIGDAKQGLITGDDIQFVRNWCEIDYRSTSLTKVDFNTRKWFPYNKGIGFRKWYGLSGDCVLWQNNGATLRSFVDESGKLKSRPQGVEFYFKEGVCWGEVSTKGMNARVSPNEVIFTSTSPTFFAEKDKYPYIISLLNSKVVDLIMDFLSPTQHFTIGSVKNVPFLNEFESNTLITEKASECILISRNDWDSNETSWDFLQDDLIRINGQDLEETFELFKKFWEKRFFKLHYNEEELNSQFIKIYALTDELTPDVPLEDITILQDELDRKALGKLNKKLKRDTKTHLVTNYKEIELPFIASEIMAQFISYSVGCMFGRYSLDKEGLIMANQGETMEDFISKIGKPESECVFLPDEDNIIPILEDEWFEDDIVGKFYKFLKVTFGEKNFSKNLTFIEEQIGKDIRKYFLRDFYADHTRRYKKRPIYWMFSSPKCSLNVLIYMHRYTPDIVSNILNKYLKEFIGKLNTRKEHLQHIQVSGTAAEINKAIKEIDNIEKMVLELREYERDILYPIATERIAIDLDDGVLVNYNKFGKALREVDGLNDKKTKEKVRKFDWIDVKLIK